MEAEKLVPPGYFKIINLTSERILEIGRATVERSTASPSPSVCSEMSDGPSKVERWENADVRLLISIWSDHKHLFGGKSTKKEVFDKIAEQFIATSGQLVTGEQCIRKWSKLLTKQKEVEDHNNKSGKDRKSWKFYNELSQCLAKDV